MLNITSHRREIQIKIILRTTAHLLGWLLSKRRGNKWGQWYGGKAASMENSIDVPQKLKNRATVGSSNTTSGNTSEGNEITILKRYVHTHVIAALFTIAKMWKQPKHLLIDKCINIC